MSIGFAWIFMDLYRFCMDLYGFMSVHMHFNVCICVFDVFMSLVWPTSVPQALFFMENQHSRILLTMSILEAVRIVRISISMNLGTCLKRRAPKNHEFWRYSDLQISHHDLIGDQNDGWSEPPNVNQTRAWLV